MSIFNLYSKRRKRERGEGPDVYQYTEIPRALRVQIVHIWTSAFGRDDEWTKVPTFFSEIHSALCREYGVFSLTTQRSSVFNKVADFMLASTNVEEVLDVIEITFRTLDTAARNNPRHYFGPQSPDEAISELNARFREHGVGFQYESGQIIRVDSQIVHSEVIRPALQLLSGQGFSGANQEYLSAHEHYRNRKFKECLNDCLKAFESTMKSICTMRKWTFRSTDTAKTLLELLFQKGIIPLFLQSHFTAFKSTLEAGVPTVRNKLGGHGQGASEIEVPDYIAAYALHLTATNILLLVDAERNSK